MPVINHNQYHPTVFLKEAVDLLHVKPGNIYLDATVGGGGHAGRIIRQGGYVVGVDWDQDAVEFAKMYLTAVCRQLKREPKDTFRLIKGNFAELNRLYQEKQPPDGILFDFGTSCHQLVCPERGFSFQADGPLDMRMDKDQAVTAADLVNRLNYGDLVHILKHYGEEKMANKIATNIVLRRKQGTWKTTGELADLVTRIYHEAGLKHTRIHPATRTFQALRVAVNYEMANLKEGLEQAFGLLKPKGCLVTICFQPMEDKLVYRFIKNLKLQQQAVIIKSPVKPDYAARQLNPSARSAVLRAIQKR